MDFSHGKTLVFLHGSIQCGIAHLPERMYASEWLTQTKKGSCAMALQFALHTYYTLILTQAWFRQYLTRVHAQGMFKDGNRRGYKFYCRGTNEQQMTRVNPRTEYNAVHLGSARVPRAGDGKQPLPRSPVMQGPQEVMLII